MNTYLKTSVKESCFGCRSCEQICPSKCISMIADDEGFIYPKLNTDNCTNCDLCKKVCPINKDTAYGLNFDKPIVYAAWNKDSEILNDSSSGGIFSALSKYIFDKNGTVFGCAFDENIVAKHIGIDGKHRLSKLRGSKYVQSDTNNSYTLTRDLLNKGKHVLYTGTPCQIAGLKSFLIKNYENLITADLVCHGVPSPKMFNQYIEYLENKHKGKIIDFQFRDKSKYGWLDSSISYKIDSSMNKKIYIQPFLSPYFYAFTTDMSERPICYSCPYTTTKREGDITIADYWGIEKFHPEIDIKNGVSLVIVNTKKGEMVFNAISTQINKTISSIENAKHQNPCLRKFIDKPEIRNILYKKINELGFEKASKGYIMPKSILAQIKIRIPGVVKRRIKKLIKLKLS